MTTVPTPAAIARDLATRWTARPARLVVVRSNRADLEQLARWIDEGTLRPTIDRVFDLADARDAHAYLETKRARGKVAIAVAPAGAASATGGTAGDGVAALRGATLDHPRRPA